MNQTFENKFPNFLAELGVNENYYSTSKEVYRKTIQQYDETLLDLNQYVCSALEYDLLRAVTYDLCRYASFHDIKEMTGDENQTLLNIEESVRAASFMKWILQLRPLRIDSLYEKNLGPNLPPPPLRDKANKFSEFKNFSSAQLEQAYLTYYCNEHLAIFVASQCLDILATNGENTHVKPITEFYKEKNGVLKLIYILRYRVKHQDTYYPVLSRFVKLFSESENS